MNWLNEQINELTNEYIFKLEYHLHFQSYSKVGKLLYMNLVEK